MLYEVITVVDAEVLDACAVAGGSEGSFDAVYAHAIVTDEHPLRGGTAFLPVLPAV